MSLRVGFVGTGGIAGQHLKHVSEIPNIVVAALCDIDEIKVKNLAEAYGAVPYTDYINMFDEANLDAVLICTPPSVRLNPVQEAASRGIPCFIEKPPALTLAEAQKIDEVIWNSGIINGVGFMFRYGEAVQKAKELTAGLKLTLIRSHFVCGVALNPHMPKWFFNKSISGGPIMDQAVHLFDLCRYLACENSGEVVEVQSFGGNAVVPKKEDFTIEDSHVVNLRYEQGTLHSHTHSWAIEPTQGIIELLANDVHLVINLYAKSGGTSLTGTMGNEPIDFQFPEDTYYMTEMKAFLKAVVEKDQSWILSTYQDALNTLKIVLAVNQSVENKEMIMLT